MRNINDTLPAFFPAHPVSYWERKKAIEEGPMRKAMSLRDFEEIDHSIREIVQEVVKEVVKPVEVPAKPVIADDDWHHPFWMAKMAQDNGLVVLASFDGGKFRTAASASARLWYFLKDGWEQSNWRYRIAGADRDGWIKNDCSGKAPIPNGVVFEIKTGMGGVIKAVTRNETKWHLGPKNGNYIFAWRFAQ